MGDSFTTSTSTPSTRCSTAPRVEELVAAAAADGQPAVGITDHGNMYGILDFYRACQAQGVKPVLGTEAYMAHDHRSERPPPGQLDDTGGETEGGRKLYYHLTAAGRDRRGLPQPHPARQPGLPRGLLLQAPARLGAARAAPRGLIATTGCLGGHVLQSLVQGDEAGAREGRPPAGHLRARQPLRGAAGPRPRRAAATPTPS